VLKARTAYANLAYHLVTDPIHHIPVVKYKDDVYLDSGASDHMTGDINNLTGLQSTLTNVILPDGSVVSATAAGTLRVSVMDNNTGERYTIPLLDTLYIPGLTKTLWSVTQFAAEGHLVIFGVDSITIMMNHSQPEELLLVIPHPFYHIAQAPLPFALAATT
jgi:hypothetical protein